MAPGKQSGIKNDSSDGPESGTGRNQRNHQLGGEVTTRNGEEGERQISPSKELTVTGENGQVYLVKTSDCDQAEESVELNLSHGYVVDPSTGNIIMIYGDTEDNEGGGHVLSISETGESMTFIRSESTQSPADEPMGLLTLLNNGQYCAETCSDGAGLQYMESNPGAGERGEEDGEQISELRVSKITSIAEEASDINTRDVERRLSKVCLWSRRKTTDLIQCIHNHEHKFRKSVKTRTNIWNEISNDMLNLGHHDCNRDECSKKWSNLYRTWKKVKLRPIDSRHKWEFYKVVSTLVKSLSARFRDKVPVKKSKELSTSDLVLKLMEENQAHQEALYEVEEKFKKQAEKLDKERDDILSEIRNVLKSTARENKPSSSNIPVQSSVLSVIEDKSMKSGNMEVEAVSNDCDHPENLAMITVEESLNPLKNSQGTDAPMYYLRIPRDFGPQNPQCQLVEIDDQTNRDFQDTGTSDPIELRVPSSSSQNKTGNSELGSFGRDSKKSHVFDILSVKRGE